MDERGKRILIVGGGTAGWLTACHLARRLGADLPGGARITLIESSEIGIVGVGEGTFPTIRNLLASLGQDEATFMRACSATYKQGARFIDWADEPIPGRPRAYNHPFNSIEPAESGLDLLPYWAMGVAGEVQVTRALGVADRVHEALRGPKRLGEAAYAGSMSYAYHFDAGQMATWLAEVGKGLGVERLFGNVERVNVDPEGLIRSVDTREHGELTADLFVDCSGFRAALLGEALGSPFRDVGDTLFVDRALAMPVPYADPKRPLPCHTLSTAHEAGWTWDIGLNDRRGVGYVYSSAHTDDSRAEAVLRSYIGPEAEPLTPRLLKFRVGFRERSWVGNCVGVGLASGFLEPLESTGIVMIGIAAGLIGDLFPRSRAALAAAARTFNKAINERFLGQIDFLKMHYCLTRRRDSSFWIDNTENTSLPDSLADQLDQWRERVPNRHDFASANVTFPIFSYCSVLYGMGFRSDLSGQKALYPHADLARREFARIAAIAERAVEILPDHRALIEETYGRAAAGRA